MVIRSKPIPSNSTTSSAAVASMSKYFFHSILRSWVRLFSSIFLHLAILLTRHIAHNPRCFTLLSWRKFRCVQVAFLPRGCCYSMYQHCIGYTIFVDHECIWPYFSDTKESSSTRLKFVITGWNQPVRRVPNIALQRFAPIHLLFF